MQRLLSDERDSLIDWSPGAGLSATKLYAKYRYRKFKYRNGGYAQLREADYAI